jgi:SAM-dependent methyltransferase
VEPTEYRTLFDVEEDLWWFRALRGVLFDAAAAEGIGPGARVLDAGCGTGMLVSALQARGFRAHGFDLSADAQPFWPRRNVTRACRATANAIPFASGSFDAVFAVDLLESDAVDEQAACAELVRVLRPGGLLFMVVPAYRALMSPSHHRAVHASRRYTRTRIRDVLSSTPARVVRTTHLFMTLFPPVAAYRLWRRFRDRPTDPACSELSAPPGWLNASLFHLTDWERALMARADLPFGSSILVVLRRNAS